MKMNRIVDDEMDESEASNVIDDCTSFEEQAELSEKLGYTDKAISKWERGESSPDPDVLLALSNIFNVQIDYFFYDVKVDKTSMINESKETKVRRSEK